MNNNLKEGLIVSNNFQLHKEILSLDELYKNILTKDYLYYSSCLTSTKEIRTWAINSCYTAINNGMWTIKERHIMHVRV